MGWCFPPATESNENLGSAHSVFGSLQTHPLGAPGVFVHSVLPLFLLEFVTIGVATGAILVSRALLASSSNRRLSVSESPSNLAQATTPTLLALCSLDRLNWSLLLTRDALCPFLGFHTGWPPCLNGTHLLPHHSCLRKCFLRRDLDFWARV